MAVIVIAVVAVATAIASIALSGLIVETEEEFNKWMAEQKTFAETVLADETEPAFNPVAGAEAEEEVAAETSEE